MFSMIFFGFVFLIVLVGFVAVMLRRRKRTSKEKASLEGNRSAERNISMPQASGFNEPLTGAIKGTVRPAENKPAQSGFNDQEQSNEEESATDRS